MFNVGDKVEALEDFHEIRKGRIYTVKRFNNFVELNEVDGGYFSYRFKPVRIIKDNFKVGDVVKFSDSNPLTFTIIHSYLSDDERYDCITSDGFKFFKQDMSGAFKVGEVSNDLPILNPDGYYHWFFTADELNGKDERVPFYSRFFDNIQDKMGKFYQNKFGLVDMKIVSSDGRPGVLCRFFKHEK